MIKKQKPPQKLITEIILHWNKMPNLATVPPESFTKHARHVIAAARNMTSQKFPNWEEARVKIFCAIQNYAEVRNNPQKYEYVKDLTLSQFLMWELEKFLDINQPLRRLLKDKRVIIFEPDKDYYLRRLRERLSSKYTTKDNAQLDALQHATDQDCLDCKYEGENLRCKHPQWPYITPEYMESCFEPKVDE